jgi:hypothetical protein
LLCVDKCLHADIERKENKKEGGREKESKNRKR